MTSSHVSLLKPFQQRGMLIWRKDKPVFGQYACAGPSGAVLHVGDEVEITDRVSRSVTPVSPVPIAQDSTTPRITMRPEGRRNP